MKARERRKMRARSLRRAYAWFRSRGVIAARALALARAESWARQTGACAIDWDLHDSDEPGMVSEVRAGFERGTSNEFVASAPSIQGTWPWLGTDADRKHAHAEALDELRRHVGGRNCTERCPDCRRAVEWTEASGWQHVDPSASCFLHRARLERAS